jgi:Sigma-70, region 4
LIDELYRPRPWWVLWHKGREAYSAERGCWVIAGTGPDDGRYWDPETGAEIKLVDADVGLPVQWPEQEIGLGVHRCPRRSGDWLHPVRRPIRRSHSDRAVYAADRRDDGATLREIAAELGVSRERVRQLVEGRRIIWR